MTRDEMLADLAYARTLAEEGRHAPLIGGSYLVFFGALIALCYAIHWAALTGALPIPTGRIGMIWVAYGVAAFLGVLALRRRVRKLPGGSAIPNRVDRFLWQGVTVAILVVVAGTVLRAVVRNDFTAPDAIAAAGFGLYGVALYVTAMTAAHGWLRAFAFTSWAISGVLWFFLNEAWLYLIAAGGSVAVLIVPGVLMMRREPTTVV